MRQDSNLRPSAHKTASQLREQCFTFSSNKGNLSQQLDFSSQVVFFQGNSSNYKERNQESSRPVIAVTMATSRQGSSVVRHLSKNGIFQIRAITRSPFSKRAENLVKLPNVEIVKGDLLEPESLERCFSGAYGIFGNTTPTKGWILGRGSMVRDYEIEQGRNLVDAVKKTC